MRWVVVVPVKPAADGKTRLAGVLSASARERLVRAMARDTVAAAVATPDVDRVVVVTADAPLRTLLAGTVELVDEPGGGLNGAVRAGIDRASAADVAVAVLLGDLPALRPDDLADALRLADAHDRAFVADADGTGTTLLTALPGVPVDPAFGPGSAAAHERAGHVRLAVGATSTVRRDVDVPEDLAEVARLGVGPATGAVL
ncbi:2-phospho-L-lactate guanylyltransferase [Cellulomonas xylanilytica]|uniref:Phosphoenolpyruvate guanylyltransferase n=1 Tax=Cellulomonas xylanilytica TaxID=233583 RepID=A0A510V1S1_9CELL|nr:2-phospho-L-lactate guanylyltransferase [Cellulomonas xylanilytica]GEK20798.1 2-phospho-L-lactate guanylyltransferase [Cellulomonas xylanilytica]